MLEKTIAATRRVSDTKLLESLVSKGTASELLLEYGSLYQLMMHLSKERLCALSTVDSEAVKQLFWLKQITERIDEERKVDLTAIHAPQDVYLYAQDMQDLQQEEFWLLMLNTKNRIIGEKQVFRGSVNSAMVSPREIFYAAVQKMASQVIVLHNHPSGDPAPSQEDKDVTRAIKAGGDLLNIPVVDHVIIGRHGYYSFKEEGCIIS